MIEKKNNTALSDQQFLNEQSVLRISGSIVKKKIATWNVRSLFQSGKIHNVIGEMGRLEIDILGVSEMRWPNSGHCVVNQYHVYHAGNDNPQHSNGVGLIVSKEVSRCVKNWLPISDRVILIQVHARPFPLNIIQVYAPTCNASDDDVDFFYSDILKAKTYTKSSEITILMGDLNAKVGCGRRENVVGNYGLGVANERGDRLVQFCQEEDLVIMNTYFKLPARRLYTWISNADRNVRNQIDYIMINRRFRNCIKSAKTYPGADVYSDHNLLSTSIAVRLKKCVKRKHRPCIDARKLQDPTIHNEIRSTLSSRLIDSFNANNNIEGKWKVIKAAVNDVTNEKLKCGGRVKLKPWMTDEILDLMDQRRRLKNSDIDLYHAIQRSIRSKIRQAKELWLTLECNEMETLDSRHDSFNLHKKVKQAAGIYRNKGSGVLADNDGNFLLTTEAKLQEWKSYIETLFNDQRSANHNVDSDDGLDITIAEVEKALKSVKGGKAPGPDDIHVEVLMTLTDDNILSVLVDLFNTIYRSGVVPIDWQKSTFITLPKKSNAKQCNDHRLISLMSHVLKLFLKIIHARIYRRCEENISATQFGFRNGFGTREALFSMQVLIQRCRDVNVDVFALFIDYEKAFDTVQHGKLMEILKKMGLDGRDTRIIANLYWNQTASVRVDGVLSEGVKILRGVRQGCVLSPLLFNLYSEFIFREIMEDLYVGVVVNGAPINNIRYADDTVLLATDLADLQILLNIVATKSADFGLKLNVKKTKWMVVSKDRNIAHTHGILTAGNEIIERVTSYKYLGCYLTDNWDNTQEIRCRIEQARYAFVKMRKVLTSRDLCISLRTRFLRCYVFSILLYGVEAWTLTEAMCKKLEAFEMWTYRRMLKIPWTARKTNTEVLNQMNKQTEIIKVVKKRKLEYFGHIMRNEKYQLLQLIIEGKIEGKRGPGRRRTSWLKNLRQWYGLSTGSLFRAAVDKTKIMQMVVNVLGGHDT